MEKIELEIQCPSCKGTGVYVGMAERGGAAVVCHTCNGTGKHLYKYEYEKFTGRKEKEGVTRVYKRTYGYCIAPKEIDFNNIGTIDMSKEGVTYSDFLNGEMPKHVEKLACPMIADQGACHDIKGFVDECENLSGTYISYIPECRYQQNKKKCWERFNLMTKGE